MNQLTTSDSKIRQFATFYLAGRWYGIDVMCVQEVTKPMPVTEMRTAPEFIKGLINLRGQIATAIGLSELFGLESKATLSDRMTVVCRSDDNLLSILVDNIGDVVEVGEDDFEPTPASVPVKLRPFIHGVYKTPGAILTIVSLDTIKQELTKKCA